MFAMDFMWRIEAWRGWGAARRRAMRRMMVKAFMVDLRRNITYCVGKTGWQRDGRERDGEIMMSSMGGGRRARQRAMAGIEIEMQRL